ncbi:HTH_Tnp_Tc3_2 domain-containing protein [Trichonephila clavipes]|nr:HTH_Tnp_Tc3_2 domain-containing protein [Trichonephila clavipes]
MHWTRIWSHGRGTISCDSKSTLVVIPNTLSANLYVSLVIEPIVLPFMNNIRGGVFQQDNAHLHTVVVRNVLYRVLTCYLGLRDHHICFQLSTYGISLDDSALTTASTGRPSIDTKIATSMKLQTTK